MLAAEGPSVDALLERLPAEQRAALEARVLQEREYADIARSLRCSEAVVRQRVSRGLRRLRAELEGDHAC
jgi:RNA polymerase sigma factor (sigma-70 family)